MDRARLAEVRRLARAGDHEAATKEAIYLLNVAPTWVDREFSHCTAVEKRSLVAMDRWQIYACLGRAQPRDKADMAAYCKLIAHAWWCVGLRLQRRREELGLSLQQERWSIALGKHAKAAVLTALVAGFPARDEKDIGELQDRIIDELNIERPRGY